MALVLASALTAADAQESTSSALNESPAARVAPSTARFEPVALKRVDTTTYATNMRKPLDLRTPDINRVFTPSQLQTMTAVREENLDDVEQVSVEGSRNQPIIAPSGLRGIPWAIRHPTQAWRLFVPSPSN